MKKTLAVAALGMLVLSAAAFAQAWTVDYFDGTAEVRSTKGWTALSLGDSLPADATVKVSNAGSLELVRGKAKITIIRDGTYNLATLARASDKSGAARGGTAISQKLQSLKTAKPASTAVGGVRAGEQGGQEAVTWVEETDETRSQVASLFAENRYLDAVKVLDEAMRAPASPADAQEYQYLTAVAWYGAGQSVKAYRALSRVSADPSAQWYAKYVLLKAQVLVDATDFTGALEVLKPFIDEYPSGEPAQMAYLLMYYCRKGLGDAASAKAALEAGYQANPTGEMAQLIDELRKAE